MNIFQNENTFRICDKCVLDLRQIDFRFIQRQQCLESLLCTLFTFLHSQMKYHTKTTKKEKKRGGKYWKLNWKRYKRTRYKFTAKSLTGPHVTSPHSSLSTCPFLHPSQNIGKFDKKKYSVNTFAFLAPHLHIFTVWNHWKEEYNKLKHCRLSCWQNMDAWYLIFF